ncbi:flagellar basal body rod C-terminal domain-containing protein [uncultured Helicobacter sp.]|uniref:flagellar basal body rod C-terminal domain-containing protein n=1 Tax=uncultured Helicobacter sp. TaxID=175537 RepID=UPI00261F8388|nr:flagellar basal body rod C-terminal domain-containing protein [uncultured Helicobacter sp.]
MEISSQNIGVYSGFNAFDNGQSGINANVQTANEAAVSISQGFLEASNVDLAQSAVGQIIVQNGMAANAQSIQTADSILQTLLDIQA